MDLHALTDAELAEHMTDVQCEQERRQRLANAPAQLAQMAARYVEDGGDKADLVAVLEDALVE